MHAFFSTLEIQHYSKWKKIVAILLLLPFLFMIAVTMTQAVGLNYGDGVYGAGNYGEGQDIPDEVTLTSPFDGELSIPHTNTTFTITTTDPDDDYLRYRIHLCENAAMTSNCQTFDQTSSQTGWSGQDTQSGTAYESGSIATYTMQTSLSVDTIYFWQAQAIDPNGTNQWSDPQPTANSFATNQKPTVVSQISPANNATNVVSKPTFTITTTDPDDDYLRYRIHLCENAAMTSNCQTFDQTSSQTGWSGQDTQSGTAYESGSTATYITQSFLTPATTYYWQVQATDPNGSNLWSDVQASPWSFETESNTAPTSPTNLRVNNLVNPTLIINTTPDFSAQFNDGNTFDEASSYEIQVSRTSTFGTTHHQWSGSLSPNVENGSQTPNITYTGVPLPLDGHTYHWRIRFTDNWATQGAWSSEVATFTMANVAMPSQCLIENASPPSNGYVVVWNDVSTIPTDFELEKNVNNGGWQNIITTSTTSYTDSSISAGDTVEYRVRATAHGQNSEWCTTALLSPDEGSMRIEGLQFY